MIEYKIKVYNCKLDGLPTDKVAIGCLGFIHDGNIHSGHPLDKEWMEYGTNIWEDDAGIKYYGVNYWLELPYPPWNIEFPI